MEIAITYLQLFKGGDRKLFIQTLHMLLNWQWLWTTSFVLLTAQTELFKNAQYCIYMYICVGNVVVTSLLKSSILLSARQIACNMYHCIQEPQPLPQEGLEVFLFRFVSLLFCPRYLISDVRLVYYFMKGEFQFQKCCEQSRFGTTLVLVYDLMTLIGTWKSRKNVYNLAKMPTVNMTQYVPLFYFCLKKISCKSCLSITYLLKFKTTAYQTRSQDCSTPRVNTELEKTSFHFIAPYKWNEL